jgi:hypothetical protein
MPYYCDYCQYPCKSRRGLTQHINGKPECTAKERARYGINNSSTLCNQKPPPVASIPTKRTHEETDVGAGFDLYDLDELLRYGKAKRSRRSFNNAGWGTVYRAQSADDKGMKLLTALAGKKVQAILDKCTPWAGSPDAPQRMGGEEEEQQPLGMQESSSEGELEIVGGPDTDDMIENPDAQAQASLGPPAPPEVPPNPPDIPPNPPDVQGPDYNNDHTINVQPNTTMRDNFKLFCENRQRSRNNTFTISEKRAVRLMGVLKGTRAALNTYDAVLEWYHREKGDITPSESLKHVNNVDKYHSRKSMIKTLSTRYYFDDKEARNSTIILPNSKATVTLTLHNAWDCIESLLTDPRVEDKDYAFHGNNPLAPPPPVSPDSMISELHTAKAYHESYKKYIKYPGKQVLLPVVMYIDGAVTGQFTSLPVTALKIALGIHTRKHREKEFAWRTLGYVAEISTPSSRGKQMFHDSRHMEAEFVQLVQGEGREDVTTDVCKAQDFHTMLDCLLTSYVEVQTKGFIWDLRYRGKTYKDIEFVPVLIFVKCDTDEADILCGSYKSRTANVAQLCRYCTCPTQESDLVFANYPPKTVPMIQELVNARDFDGLKKLSQQMIKNAWYKIRFHPWNKQGIHGACPSEMLHALLLGVFKYTRECFFEQIGPTSKAARSINGLAQLYGDLLDRQSDRDKPKCSFGDGINGGKVMAKEFRGILLVIAAVLRSQKGQDLLSRKENFSSPQDYKDWVLLIEMLLEWEAFLNEPEMTVKHIRSLQMKNRFIMYLVKKTCNRTKGMGMKLMKFHAIIHMILDIYLFGVPTEVDTGANESHHKVSKIAARLTQKNVTTFDFQTCTRLDEFFLIDLAMAELNDDLKLWEYFTKPADPLPQEPTIPAPKTGGAIINVWKDEKFGKEPVFSLGVGKKAYQPLQLEWNRELVRFLYDLQKKLQVEKLQIRGEHKRGGLIFRGHPNYREKPWRDWALIKWDKGKLPGQIWCFVVIDSDPQVRDKKSGKRVRILHGDIEVKKGTYAVMETATYDTRDEEKKKSDLFIPIKKVFLRTPEDKAAQARRRHKDKGNQAKGARKNDEAKCGWERKFCLANVEAIEDPLVVVPNVGGRLRCEHLILKPRSQWVDIFKKWLDDPNEDDRIPLTEPVPEHNILQVHL